MLKSLMHLQQLKPDCDFDFQLYFVPGSAHSGGEASRHAQC